MAWPKGRPNPNSAAACRIMHEHNRGRQLSPEHRARLSEVRKGRKRSPELMARIADKNRGRIHTPEARARMGNKPGFKMSDEWKAKLSASNHNKGKPLSDEVKAKIRATALGRPARHGKRVQYNGNWYRSTWEVRAVKALEILGVAWRYEPRSFFLNDGSRYTPDFFLPDDGAYWEIKGWWSDIAKHKVTSFREKYSDIPLVVLTKQGLEALEASASMVAPC